MNQTTRYLKLVPPEDVENAAFRRGVGCKECLDTGFSGRTAVTEMLVVDEILRDAILQKLPTLWQMRLRRVVGGQTTLEEILRVVAMDQF